MPATNAVGFEYGVSVSHGLAEHAIGEGLAPVNRQRGARLVRIDRRRVRAPRTMDAITSWVRHPRRERYIRHGLARRNVIGNPFRKLLPSRCLPDLERPLIPAETPADGEIEIARVVGDIGERRCAIVESISVYGPQKLSLGMAGGVQLAEARRNVLVL